MFVCETRPLKIDTKPLSGWATGPQSSSSSFSKQWPSSSNSCDCTRGQTQGLSQRRSKTIGTLQEKKKKQEPLKAIECWFSLTSPPTSWTCRLPCPSRSRWHFIVHLWVSSPRKKKKKRKEDLEILFSSTKSHCPERWNWKGADWGGEYLVNRICCPNPLGKCSGGAEGERKHEGDVEEDVEEAGTSLIPSHLPCHLRKPVFWVGCLLYGLHV